MAESIEELVFEALSRVKADSSRVTAATYAVTHTTAAPAATHTTATYAATYTTTSAAPCVEVTYADIDSAVRAAIEKKNLKCYRASADQEPTRADSEVVSRQRKLLAQRKRKGRERGAPEQERDSPEQERNSPDSESSALEKLVLIHATPLPGIRREGKIADLTRDVYERYILIFCPTEIAEWIGSDPENRSRRKIHDVSIQYKTKNGSYVERMPLIVVDVNPEKPDEWRLLPEPVEIKGMENGDRKIGLLIPERQLGAGGSGTAHLYSDVFRAETRTTELGPVRVCSSVVVKRLNKELIGTFDEGGVVDSMIREGFIGDEIRRVEKKQGVKFTNLGAPRFIPGGSAADHRVISPWLDVSPTDAVKMYSENLGRTDLALVRAYQEMLNIIGALAYVGITHNDIKVDLNGNMLARIAEPTDFSKLQRPERIPEKVWKLILERPLCEGPVMTVLDFGSANLPWQERVRAFTPYNVDDAYIIMNGANFWSDVYTIGLAMADIFTDFVFLEARRTENNTRQTTEMIDYMKDFNRRRDEIFGRDFINDVLRCSHDETEERITIMQPALESIERSNKEWHDAAREACGVLGWDVNIPYLARAHTLPLEERFLRNPETTDALVRVYSGLCSNIRSR
jgi:hypothetical protein